MELKNIVAFMVLQVIYLSGKLNGDNATHYANLGDNATLPCSFNDIPVTWNGIYDYQLSQGMTILPGLPENLRKRLSISQNNELIIKDVVSTDIGMYRCTDQNGNSFFVSLVLIESPTSLAIDGVIDNKFITDENKLVNVTCVVVGGKPPPVLKLYWERGLLKTGLGPTLISLIKPERSDDSTNLTCSASHNETNYDLITVSSLQLNFGPISMNIAGPTLIYEGRESNFSCTTTGSRPPLDITWNVNEEYMNSSSTAYTILPDGTYKVRSVLTLDPDRSHNNGHVSCSTWNTSNNAEISKQLGVEVYYPPSVTIDVEKINDDMQILKCQADGNPKLYTFDKYWHHTSLFNEYIREIESAENGLLKLTVPNGTSSYENDGIYFCYVVNGLTDINGTIIKSKGYTRIKHEGAPKITDNNKLNYYSENGEKAIITLTYTSNPEQLRETWFKVLPSGEMTSVGSLKYTILSTQVEVMDVYYGQTVRAYGYISALTVKSVSDEDFASYIVVIENEKGNASATFQLLKNNIGHRINISEKNGSLWNTSVALISVGSVFLAIAFVLSIGCYVKISRHQGRKQYSLVYDTSYYGNETKDKRVGNTIKEWIYVRPPLLPSLKRSETIKPADERYVPEQQNEPQSLTSVRQQRLNKRGNTIKEWINDQPPAVPQRKYSKTINPADERYVPEEQIELHSLPSVGEQILNRGDVMPSESNGDIILDYEKCDDDSFETDLIGQDHLKQQNVQEIPNLNPPQHDVMVHHLSDSTVNESLMTSSSFSSGINSTVGDIHPSVIDQNYGKENAADTSTSTCYASVENHESKGDVSTSTCYASVENHNSEVEAVTESSDPDQTHPKVPPAIKPKVPYFDTPAIWNSNKNQNSDGEQATSTDCKNGDEDLPKQ